jgi:hypothetical protein
MYLGSLIKLKSAIFRRNSIFNPGFNYQAEKKQISYRFLYPGAVPEYRTKNFDS